tara:strand:- start:10968 stop:11417 length:450 start_codon:yes stop_codon:yes gene_type:complete
MTIISNNHILTKTETGRKSGRYHYQVKDLQGTVISERKSNRDYIGATLDGGLYFGRADLIGRGEHGNRIKYLDKVGIKTKIKNREDILVAVLSREISVRQGHESGACYYVEDKDGNTMETIWTQYESGESSDEARERAEKKANEIKANL